MGGRNFSWKDAALRPEMEIASPAWNAAFEPQVGAPGFEPGRTLVKHIVAITCGGVSFVHRIKMLDNAAERADAVLAELAEVYARSPQPMGAHAREALALARSLAFVLARGYHVAAGQPLDDAAPGTKRKIAPLLLKAMRYVAEVMRASYKTYSRLPEGAWKQMHQLYLDAEREGVAMGVADARSGTSVMELYCESLLLSLVDPYRLESGEIDRIEALVRELHAPATVSKERPETRPTCQFLIPTDDDLPPRPFREGDSAAGPAARVLDTAALVESLRALLRVQDGRAALVAKLVSLWDDPPKRVFRRDAAEGSVAICVGVKPIAHFVAHEAGIDGESEQRALREGLTMPLRSLPEDESGQAIPIHEWAVINVSAGGVRVRRSALTAYPITIGEVVGIRAPGKVLWRIGVTRWVTGLEDGTTEFGVQFFANAVCAVWVKHAQPTSARRLALLVAEDEGGAQELLLTPSDTYAEGAEFELRGEGFRSRVRADGLIEGNTHFQLFRVTPA